MASHSFPSHYLYLSVVGCPQQCLIPHPPQPHPRKCLPPVTNESLNMASQPRQTWTNNVDLMVPSFIHLLMPPRPPIPKQLLDLPPSAGPPWSAEVVQAHHGLYARFRASCATLNLDESDAICLGHHLHQAKTIMVPIVEALQCQHSNPLPSA